MKYLLPCLLLLAACEPARTPQQRLIIQYVRENANDPASYEPISFGEPRPCRLSDLPGAGPADTALIGVKIEHTYRAKNKFGALTKETTDFVVSSLNNDVIALDTDGTAY